MSKPLKWIYLAHLGYNMWLEPEVDRFGIHGQQGWSEHIAASGHLRFEEDYWQELTVQLKDAGCNTILLDLGEGLCYESHPELAVEGSWSKEKLSRELSRLRSQGFEVLPKLNFSAALPSEGCRRSRKNEPAPPFQTYPAFFQNYPCQDL